MTIVQEQARAVLEIFGTFDRGTSLLAQAAGLSCPAGCGRCCTTPAIETSVLEMLPMALEIARRGELQAWLARGQNEEAAKLCLAYEASAQAEDRGRCSHYETRPAICRLYGFAGRRNRYGETEFVACPVHEEESPKAVERARELVAGGLPLSLFTTPPLHLRAVDMRLAQERLPIRQALLRALEYVALHLKLSGLGPASSVPPTPEDQAEAPSEFH